MARCQLAKPPGHSLINCGDIELYANQKQLMIESEYLLRVVWVLDEPGSRVLDVFVSAVFTTTSF